MSKIPRIFVVTFVVAMAMTAMLYVISLTFPIINDITTDTDRPPAFFMQPKGSRIILENLAYNPAFGAMQRRAYPHIAPIALPLRPEVTFDLAKGVAKTDLAWSIIGSDQGSLRFQATDRSLVFGFTSDIVVSVARTEDGSVVNIRCRSRFGSSDFGTNAKRIARFSELLAVAARR